MAWLKTIRKTCWWARCNKTAVKELFDRKNLSCGYFCVKHGNQALEQLKAREQASDGDGRR